MPVMNSGYGYMVVAAVRGGEGWSNSDGFRPWRFGEEALDAGVERASLSAGEVSKGEIWET